MSVAMETALELCITYGLRLVAALILLIVGRYICKLIVRGVEKVLAKVSPDPMLVSFMGTMTYIMLLTFLAVAVLGQLGVETASIIAVVGTASLAIGLALQGGLANFASGFLMVIFRPFRVGDEIDGAGLNGVVEKFELFTTQIRTRDNLTVIVPNSKLSASCLVNISAKDERRVDLTVSIGYGDDIDQVLDIANDELSRHPLVLSEPAPEVGVLRMGHCGIELAIRPWCKTDDYWPVFFDVGRTIRRRFAHEGISLPKPGFDQEPGDATSSKPWQAVA